MPRKIVALFDRRCSPARSRSRVGERIYPKAVDRDGTTIEPRGDCCRSQCPRRQHDPWRALARHNGPQFAHQGLPLVPVRNSARPANRCRINRADHSSWLAFRSNRALRSGFGSSVTATDKRHSRPITGGIPPFFVTSTRSQSHCPNRIIGLEIGAQGHDTVCGLELPNSKIGLDRRSLPKKPIYR
jgi:hypothetical protein